MLRVMMVCPDSRLADLLEKALSQFASDVTIVRVLGHYPEPAEAGQALRAQAPDVVFVSFEQPEVAAALVRAFTAQAPGLQVVAMHASATATMLRESMRVGIREFITPPFENSTLSHALGSALQNLDRKPVQYAASDQVFCFLPSKAGAGTSSLALNMAATLAQEEGRVLLADLDLNSGSQRFLSPLSSVYSVADAVQQFANLDERKWPEFVTSFGNLDVLHAGAVNPAVRLDHQQMTALVQFLRRNYGTLCFDLSGNLERYSIEIMQQSRHVILVCTPEIPSLHLAREKIAFLKVAGLEHQVLAVMNRVTRHSIFSKAHVEDVLGVPVFATFTNQYATFADTARYGAQLDFDSPLGQECLDFAAKLLRKPAPAQRETGPRFLQFLKPSKPSQQPWGRPRD